LISGDESSFMTQNKPSRMGRIAAFFLFRVIPAMLIAACFFFGFQIAQAVFGRVRDDAESRRQLPLFAQTATALAGAEAPQSRVVGYQSVRFSESDRFFSQFATNTPQPADGVTPLTATELVATPEPPTVPAATQSAITPNPLPTLFIYADPNQPLEAGGTAVPTVVPTLDRQGYDLMNILLIGHDGELTDDGFVRTDTMIVASINRTTGSVSMLSLPRDLYVYIPGWTMQRLNLAYIHGEAVGWTEGGFGLLRQTLLYNLGVNVHYFAMVNLTGFKGIVDAIGGVDLAVDCALEDLPLIGAEIPQGAYRVNEEGFYVLPVGYYSMTGAEALWYARSRNNTDDFDRGRRQQQVLRAVWRKARATGLLNNVVTLWNQSSELVETTMVLEDVLGLVPLALSIDTSQIEDYRLVRTYHTTPWQPPDGSYVQLPVYDTMRPLLQDFYTPPTENQLVLRQASIHVYNGSGNDQWDRVAAERLAWDGFGAVAMGSADTQTVDTILIDYTGRTKGSSVEDIARIANVLPENILSEPDPNRTVDFEIILGSNYNSCIEQGIIPVSG